MHCAHFICIPEVRSRIKHANGLNTIVLGSHTALYWKLLSCINLKINTVLFVIHVFETEFVCYI